MIGAFLKAVTEAVEPWWRTALDLVFPPRCQVCGAPDQFPLCRGCWSAFPRIVPPVCQVCGRPLRGPPDLVFTCVPCRHCRPLVRVRAFGRYEGGLRDAVHALKYRGKLALAEPLGRALGELVAAEELLAGTDGIAPVPLHKRRQADRGFNQAEEMAHPLGRLLGKPVVRALIRVRDTRSQTELDEEERRSNVRDAFRVCGEVRGMRLLLVDDVVTTGSTLRECARVLKAAGAADVCAVTVAMATHDP